MLENVRTFIDFVKSAVPIEMKSYYWAAISTYSSPALWLFVVFVIVLERLWPADPDQPIFSGGLWQDFIWFNLDIAVNVALIPAIATLLRAGLDLVTGGHNLAVGADWPTASKVIASALAVDLLFYIKHRFMHRVPGLWHFHAIHHSQREMNILTDRRQHLVEQLLIQIMVLIPLIGLGMKPFPVMAVGTSLLGHSLFIHSNVRTNFGKLGAIFVSPQYHRIHHSMEPRHFDRNFGAYVTLWDRMFGTHYRASPDEYPRTGVAEVEFRTPRLLAPREWITATGQQLWYPFARLMRWRQR